jgi:hypothetical protein
MRPATASVGAGAGVFSLPEQRSYQQGVGQSVEAQDSTSAAHIERFHPRYGWMKPIVFLLTPNRDSTDRGCVYACDGNPITQGVLQ